MLGIGKPNVVADRLKLTPGATGGVRTVPHAGDDTCDDGSQRKGPGDKENGSGTPAGLTGELVGDQEAETKTGRGLREPDSAAHGQIFRKLVEGKL
jgi:hypothetical protein